MSISRYAWADGLATIADDNTTLDAWFPKPALGRKAASHAIAPELLAQQGRDDSRRVTLRAISIEIDLDAGPADTADAYLRLHLLSARRCAPRTIDLTGVFSRREMAQGDQLDHAALRAASPIARVHDVRTPTLILHGLDDQRCPVGQAEAWFAGLREAGTPAQLVMYPGASHLFIIQGQLSQRIDYRERLFAWLEQWAPETAA